jgi:hypothetical protein
MIKTDCTDCRGGFADANNRAESHGPFKLPSRTYFVRSGKGVSYPCIFFSRI